MKKKFLLLSMLLLAGFFFPAINDNSLKACCKDACAGERPVMIKATIQVNTADAEDGYPNMLMNPFQQI